MDTIIKYFFRIVRAIRRESADPDPSTKLGHGEIRTLHFIVEHPGTTQQEISYRFEINKSATARQCAHLEEKGLIYRTENERDGRSHLLHPTDLALKRQSNRRSSDERTIEKLLGGFTDDEKDELTKLLQKICDNIPDHRGGHA